MEQRITEGLAVYSDKAWHSMLLHELARSLLDRRQLVRMRELVKKKGFLGNDEVTYPPVGSFVKFIYEAHGREAIMHLGQSKPDKREIEKL